MYILFLLSSTILLMSFLHLWLHQSLLFVRVYSFWSSCIDGGDKLLKEFVALLESGELATKVIPTPAFRRHFALNDKKVTWPSQSGVEFFGFYNADANSSVFCWSNLTFSIIGKTWAGIWPAKIIPTPRRRYFINPKIIMISVLISV